MIQTADALRKAAEIRRFFSGEGPVPQAVEFLLQRVGDRPRGVEVHRNAEFAVYRVTR
jgi:hypothetical protein